MGIFGLGLVLYFIVKNRYIVSKKLSYSMIFGSLLTMLLFTQVKVDFLPTHIIYGILFVLLTYSLSLFQIRIVVNKVWMYIGKLSFSIYLTHFFVLRMVFFFVDKISLHLEWFTFYLLLFTLTLFFSILVSMITYNYIEKPFMKLGNNLITTIENSRKGKSLDVSDKISS